MGICKKGINNKIDWKMICHMSGQKEHLLLYRARFMKKDIQCEIQTPIKRDSGGYKEFGKAKTYFSIDNDGRIFNTEKDLINALMDV